MTRWVWSITITSQSVATIACETTHQWLALRSVAPLEAFADMKFDALETRLTHDAEIDSVLEAWCADQDGRTLADELKRAGVPAAYVSRPSDLYEDPQLAHRDFFKVLNHTVMGPTPYDADATVKLSGDVVTELEAVLAALGGVDRTGA